MGFMKWLGDEDSMDDLVKRAQILLKEKETGPESKALALRRETKTPLRDEMSLPPATLQRGYIERSDRSDLVIAPGAVIWLPRVCSVEGEGWVYSYIGEADGRFSPGEGIRMPKTRWQLFKRNALLNVVDVGDRSHEECPWCGASCRGWAGPVLCSKCHARVCFGRTTADDYFRCHPNCGSEGQLTRTLAKEFGFTPSLHRGGQAIG
jgi:hypothetical protein